MVAKISVVISTWIGSPKKNLQNLLSSLEKYDSKIKYDLYLCANGEEYRIAPELQKHFKDVFVRQNSGYNIGAWDYAWRRIPQSDYFLFLQDDCFIKRNGWLSEFLKVFERNKKCGLVGEHFNKGWDHSWEKLKRNSNEKMKFSEQKIKRALYYNEIISSWGINPGDRASHITSVVHFTSRKILEEIDGYKIGRSYQEAIAAEIGFSRAVAGKGYNLVQVKKQRHTLIGHPQWTCNSFFEIVKKRFFDSIYYNKF